MKQHELMNNKNKSRDRAKTQAPRRSSRREGLDYCVPTIDSTRLVPLSQPEVGVDARTWVHVDGWSCHMEHVRGMSRSLLAQWDAMRG